MENPLEKAVLDLEMKLQAKKENESRMIKAIVDAKNKEMALLRDNHLLSKLLERHGVSEKEENAWLESLGSEEKFAAIMAGSTETTKSDTSAATTDAPSKG